MSARVSAGRMVLYKQGTGHVVSAPSSAPPSVSDCLQGAARRANAPPVVTSGGSVLFPSTPGGAQKDSVPVQQPRMVLTRSETPRRPSFPQVVGLGGLPCTPLQILRATHCTNSLNDTSQGPGSQVYAAVACRASRNIPWHCAAEHIRPAPPAPPRPSHAVLYPKLASKILGKK